MMTPIGRNDRDARSEDIIAQNVENLKNLFPECVSEGKIDIAVLKQLIGTSLLPEEEKDEKYGLNWFGKRKARQIALTPSTGTLRPCKEDSVDWDTTKNLMIEGDNLEVLKILQKSYSSKVKLIFIDPPYNTGSDFIYNDDYFDNIRNYLDITGQTEEGAKIQANVETHGRFHTSWLNMVYPRLKIARNLLCRSGTIFITIDDNEVDNLKKVCSEIFGVENFLGCITWQKKYAPANDTVDFSATHDFILVYAKERTVGANGRYEAILNREARTTDMDKAYINPDHDQRGVWKPGDYTCNKSSDERPNLFYSILQPNTREEIYPNRSRVWAYSKDMHERNVADHRVWWGIDGTNKVPAYKRFLNEVEGVVAQTVWDWNDVGHNDEAKKELKSVFDDESSGFETPKPTRLIRRIIKLATTSSNGELILDFFAGSGTTAHAVYDQNSEDSGNRRCISIQLPEQTGNPTFPLISTITKERLRRAGKRIRQDNPMFNGDLGFRVFKLDSSNIRAWEPEWDTLEDVVKNSVDHIKDGRTEADILYELLLKLGLDLSVPIEEKKISEKKVYAIGAGTLIVCLDKKIARSHAEPLALGIVEWHKQLAPVGETTCVFLDSAFADDVAKTNLSAILQQHGLENVRSL